MWVRRRLCIRQQPLIQRALYRFITAELKFLFKRLWPETFTVVS